MFRKSPLWLMHIVLFTLSFFALWTFRGHDVVSLYLFELCALYIAITHQRQRELLPPLAIIIGFKLASLPLWFLLFSEKTISLYLVSIIGYNLLLASVLIKFYLHDSLRQLFKVATPRRKIPQVLAMASILAFAAGHLGLVLVEVRIYAYDPTIFEGVPFFYKTYEAASLSIKALLLLAIWSMCLDSYFVDYERYKNYAVSGDAKASKR